MIELIRVNGPIPTFLLYCTFEFSKTSWNREFVSLFELYCSLKFRIRVGGAALIIFDSSGFPHLVQVVVLLARRMCHRVLTSKLA